MIQECFRHAPGIGPKTESLLRQSGFNTWEDCFSRESEIPFNGARRKNLLNALREGQAALETGNIEYFVDSFPTAEQWRILSRYLDAATFIDVETTGLSWHYSHASVISAMHRGSIISFVYGENMNDFLELADEAELLVTFNGNCFDVPFIEKTFNIPRLDAPHIDLRWIAWHCGYQGGLKWIERQLGIRRPPGIDGIDGFEAVDLFFRWQRGDSQARDLLVHYCETDVLSTYLVAERLLVQAGCELSVTDPGELFKRMAVCP